MPKPTPMPENRGVIRWATKDRGTGLYLRRGWTGLRDRWVRNPAEATLDMRRDQWSVAARVERRVKVYMVAREDPPR